MKSFFLFQIHVHRFFARKLIENVSKRLKNLSFSKETVFSTDES